MVRKQQNPSPRGRLVESGVPNETPTVHICQRGDGSAIYAVGRSLRDRRPGRVVLRRDCMGNRHLDGAPPTHQLPTNHQPTT